jgi:hypothetical protein
MGTRTRRACAALLLGAASLAASGCLTYDLAALLRAPTVGFHGLQLLGVEFDGDELEIRVLVQLDFRNYSGTSVTVPGHRLRFTLGHGEEVEAIVPHDADISVAAGGAALVDYPVVLTLPMTAFAAGPIFGTDAPYSFEILPQNDLANALLALLGQQFPGTVPRLRYQNTVRLPLPPSIQSVGIAKARLLLDPALTPRVNLGPTVEALATALDPLLEQTAGADDAAALVGLDLAGLRAAWAQLVAADLAVPLVVPAAVLGVRLELPVRIRNQNDFPIEAPLASSGLFVGLGGADPAPEARAIGRFAYEGTAPSLAAGAQLDTVLSFSLLWSNAGAGLETFFVGGDVSGGLELDARLRLDLGYGPLELPFRTQVPSLNLGTEQ